MPDSRTTHHVEAGRKGAAKRWGPPRRISIGDLTPDQRRLVLAQQAFCVCLCSKPDEGIHVVPSAFCCFCRCTRFVAGVLPIPCDAMNEREVQVQHCDEGMVVCGAGSRHGVLDQRHACRDLAAHRHGDAEKPYG